MFLHRTAQPASLWARQRCAAIALAVGLVGCSGNGGPVAESEAEAPVAQADSPVVVATTSVLCDLTQQIAETTVALTCLLDPGTDPHTYQVKPSDRQALEQADLILYDGYGSAPTLIEMVEESATEATRVAVYEQAVPTPLMGEAHDHDHSDEAVHAEGDEHNLDHDHSATADADSVPDPHIWHSATHNAAMISVIADRLAETNPVHADLYAENASRLGTQFEGIDRWIQTQVATVPADQRQLVTTHNSFGYFANAYGFEVKGALSGLSTDEKPTPGTLTALVEQVKAAQVPAIFAETTTNPQLIETVAKDAGVTVAEQPLFVEGPGGPGSAAETMQDVLVVNTCVVVEALGGSCDRANAPL
ncbi:MULTISPECIES: metal ABC transporter substrate-binding protein [Cyanophyceae]|uniref:metal ABC transporter substrate-binding protein n=1 Tax=Cyanophyceae TaxID=3028117 RepID=UPI001684FD7A|nr:MULTISPECIES: metal ABC transporter substrate-binding protein [Cyanophyceae]MBD1916564.1 zinc ABC transporter substrate-binding protein [Phormidium sp. FACHB-77]MBD2032131.1 zinc ABC transporter substrate-binding protein [Phormidium sp. FACHB-322]MBD2053011.1 zinc ABC transporter substrate-binding protein [Leptolyngbya sp. FACHB-60]